LQNDESVASAQAGALLQKGGAAAAEEEGEQDGD
jgi:hypothetical protein